jgi:hypothetical protein
MAVRNSKRSSFAVAVPVSYRLQFYTVFVAFSAAVMQALMFIAMDTDLINFNRGRISLALPYLTSSIIFPLLIFIIAFLTSRRYPAAINRWFIAVLKSILAILAFATVQTVWQWVSISYYRVSQNSNGIPPAWITGPWSVYASMVIVITGMLLVVYRQKQVK